MAPSRYLKQWLILMNYCLIHEWKEMSLDFNQYKETNSGVYIYKYRLYNNFNRNKETNLGVYIY